MKYTRQILPEKWWFTIPEGKEREVAEFSDNHYKRKNDWFNAMSTHRVVYNQERGPVLSISPSNSHVEISYEDFERLILKKEFNYEIY